MNASNVQRRLKELLSRIFGKENIKSEWRSNANAEDWLRYGSVYRYFRNNKSASGFGQRRNQNDS
jgi:hypothetical protein